ncbi:hypothetical protein MTO96_001025 [Rhipicephalus appendiculatus]
MGPRGSDKPSPREVTDASGTRPRSASMPRPGRPGACPAKTERSGTEEAAENSSRQMLQEEPSGEIAPAPMQARETPAQGVAVSQADSPRAWPEVGSPSGPSERPLVGAAE